PPPPMLAIDTLEADSVKTHAAASCTVKVTPPAVIVADRAVAAVFAAALNPMVPLADPDPPAVTVSHVALLTAVHEHPVGVVIVIVPVPPAAANDWLAD